MNKASRVLAAFQDARARNEAALVVYMTGGFPDLNRSMGLVRSCAQHGADIIEIGVPFSDPVADGPAIQYSSHAALEQGVTLQSILNAIHDLDIEKPIVVMSYFNPIFAYGWPRFLDTAAQNHVDGLIIPDLPVEEATQYASDAQKAGLDLILLAALTSTPDRLQRIVDTTQGFVYCVSMTGTTGVQTSFNNEVLDFLKRVRSVTDKPRAIGFGISKPDHIQSLRTEADGVIIGSRFIEAIRNNEDIEHLTKIMKNATRR